MNQKLSKVIFTIGIFAGGVFLGKRLKARSKVVFAGTLVVDGEGDIHVVLDENPSTFKDGSTIIFNVDRIQ